MSYRNLTDSGGATTQVYTAALPGNSIQVPLRHVRVIINTGATGTIKVIDGTTGTTANVATITNPAVGQVFDYWDMTNVRIVTSATMDITIGIDGSGSHAS